MQLPLEAQFTAPVPHLEQVNLLVAVHAHVLDKDRTQISVLVALEGPFNVVHFTKVFFLHN